MGGKDQPGQRTQGLGIEADADSCGVEAISSSGLGRGA
jgi:hypothetical protein